jgi:N-acetylmuramoyl-L-alanine amidase
MNKDKIVILDPGHGGVNPLTGKYVTPGKRSPVWDNGLQYFEGVGNRQIAIKASQYLRASGWKVYYTTDPKSYIDTSLGKRIKRSNEIYFENPTAFQISIHSDAFKKNVGQGATVFTSVGTTSSDTLASIWMDEHIKLFPQLTIRSDRRDGDVDKENHLAMNKVKCPSILIETMFHTFEEECKILMSAKGQEKIAIAISEACIQFHNNTYAEK